MTNNKVFKQKVAHSFDLAKRDIYALYQHIEWLTTRLEKVEEDTQKLRKVFGRAEAHNVTLAHAIEAVKGELDECRAECCN